MKVENFTSKIIGFKDEEISKFSSLETKELFETAQELFFLGNGRNYWKIKPCEKFVESKGIEPQQFVSFLECLFKKQFPYCIGNNGRKGAMDFIKNLKNSKHFRSKSNNKFKVATSLKLDFIRDMKALQNKYKFKKSQEAWIKHIHRNYETNYTFNSLRQIYKDKV